MSTTYHLRNESGIEVFTGTIAPAPGGSSSVRRVLFPFTFATPNLLIGVVVATLADGETLIATSGINKAGTPTLYIPTAWNGTTPKGTLAADNRSDAPSDFGDTQDMTLADAATIGSGNDLWATGNYAAALAASNGSLQARGGPIDLVFRVDDGGGGDPGASQGVAQIVLVILAA